MSAITTYNRLMERLNSYSQSNQLAEMYYEGEQRVPLLNIATPPIMNGIRIAVGWPATTCDVLGERIDFQGWEVPGSQLNDIFLDNELDLESQLGHLDALILGTSYVSLGSGNVKAGEPKVLITVDSAKDMIGLVDRRTRRLAAAARRGYDERGEWTRGVLFERGVTTYLRRATDTSRWQIERVDRHNLPHIPVWALPNRTRASRREGKSEITKTVRSLTNMTVRTLMGMEVNREFFSAPQRYALGAKEDAFTDPNGNPIPGWMAIMGSLWNLERDEEWVEDHPGSDGLPTVGEFSPNPPGPYIDQIEGLAKMFSAEVGIPAGYLGFASDDAPSADSIRALEARLVKRADRRISAWDPRWRQIGQLAEFLHSGNELPLSEILTSWGDTSIPARGADTDRAVKMIGVGMIPAESDVALDIVGMNSSTKRRVKRDRNKASMMSLITGITNDGGGEEEPNDDVGSEPPNPDARNEQDRTRGDARD